MLTSVYWALSSVDNSPGVDTAISCLVDLLSLVDVAELLHAAKKDPLQIIY